MKVGDHFAAVNGKDVSTLTDAEVVTLFRGAPGVPLTLSLCPRAEASQQEKLYEAARIRDDSGVKALLAAGAQPDALYRGIVISRRRG